MTSGELADRLGAVTARLNLPANPIEPLTGIAERRFWDPDEPVHHAAARVARQAIDAAGIAAEQVGLLINTSVCRDYLEPSMASLVHGDLGLAPECANFDLANACLGVHERHRGGGPDDRGGAGRLALLVDGESAREIVESTIRPLLGPRTTAQDFWDNFAALTLKSAAVAMVFARADRSRTTHRVNGSVALADTAYNRLCLGTAEWMVTDSPRLLKARVGLGGEDLTATGHDGGLADLARASQEQADPRLPARLAVVAGDIEELRRKLASGFDAPGVHYAYGAEPGVLAFLFPGQGSQYLRMGADLAIAFDAAREVWDRYADAALHDVVFPRPAFTDEARAVQASRLTATEWAQPAIGMVSLSQLALLRRLGVRPDCAGGHSFGEVTALHAGSVLDEASFLRVARRRGELMAAAGTEPGAMVATSVSLAEARELIEPWQGALVMANHNGLRQVVLSGPAAQVPVYANATAGPYPAPPEAARRLLAEQMSRPVRFADQVEAMYRAGVRTFLEVGPNAVLTGLVGACLAGRPHRPVHLDRPGQHGLTGLWNAVGRLWVAGVPMDVSRLWDGYPPACPPGKKAPGLTLRISGTNYGKPYPPPGSAGALPPPNPPRPEAPPPAVAGRNPGWVQAYQEMRRQTAEAQAAYQQAMTDSHLAFLQATEASFTALSTLGNREPDFPTLAPMPPPAPLPGHWRRRSPRTIRWSPHLPRRRRRPPRGCRPAQSPRCWTGSTGNPFTRPDARVFSAR